ESFYEIGPHVFSPHNRPSCQPLTYTVTQSLRLRYHCAAEIGANGLEKSEAVQANIAKSSHVLTFDTSPQRNGTVLNEHYALARAKIGDLLNSVIRGMVMGHDHSRCSVVDFRLKRFRRKMR